jgi:hypothetical protein
MYRPIDSFTRVEVIIFIELKELPTSIGQLTTLQKLDLSWWSKLKELPTSIGQLTTLQKFYLSQCDELKEFPTFYWPIDNFARIDCGNVLN